MHTGCKKYSEERSDFLKASRNLSFEMVELIASHRELPPEYRDPNAHHQLRHTHQSYWNEQPINRSFE